MLSQSTNGAAGITALLLFAWLSSGFEIIQSVPQARGRVVDANSGRAVAHAEVVRTRSGVTKKKITNSDGEFHFHGKWRLQVALGDTLRAPRSYVIEANGFQTFSTNFVTLHWATSGEGETDNLGTIALRPR